MPRPVRIAICQFESHPPTQEDSVSKNFARLKHFVSDAAKNSADLIVFPEYFLTGIIADHLHLATDEGHWIEDLRALAKEFSIDIVAGTVVEKSSRNNEHLFNTARYIDKHGNVIGEYLKKNLWHPEKEYLRSSTEEHQVFQTDKFKAGLLICWDLAWPEAFRALLLQGVEVVIVPTCWVLDDVGEIGLKHDPEGLGEISWLDSLVVNRAYENECCVVFVNCGGPRSSGFLGRSSIALPFKGALTRMESPDEEMRIVDIDLDILKDAREVYKIREDLEGKLDSAREVYKVISTGAGTGDSSGAS
ncbi:carbon-nitrogen hydrolase [Stereum hirsutum FP-91666 SS1]|uniref:carbon-nitrogen hydrolase n=1 Tax=Stereum hirsutum (strain FP-91666) TaxID=721885 RepID=UPI000444A386|nr:carbon-nitrogen hydrolase [Stereum hirsutum FP-91666 SS1]EIM86927.1 carbon-nitrogen hydrolase [Stereum hirsutum FP-91666 SS1]